MLNLRNLCRFLCNITGDFYTLNFIKKTGGLYQNVIITSFYKVRFVPKMYAKPLFKNCVTVDKEKAKNNCRE